MKVTTVLKGEMPDITWFQSVIRGDQVGLGSATEKEFGIFCIFERILWRKRIVAYRCRRIEVRDIIGDSDPPKNIIQQ